VLPEPEAALMCVLPDFQETPLSCRETGGRGAGPKGHFYTFLTYRLHQITPSVTMKNTIKIPKFWTRESILIFRTWPSQTLEISGKTQRKHPDVGILKRYDHDKPRRQGAEVICFGKGPNMPE
jgi:hypothetical protein